METAQKFGVVSEIHQHFPTPGEHERSNRGNDNVAVGHKSECTSIASPNTVKTLYRKNTFRW